MKTVICDARLPGEARGTLESLGYRILELPPDGRLSAPLASHTDMLIFRYKGSAVVDAQYARTHPDVIDFLTHELGLDIAYDGNRTEYDYPYDAILNALVIGRKLFVKADTVSKDILSLAEKYGLEIYSTRQGYPACTVLPLGDDAAITADRGLAKALCDAGISVTLIENSDKIRLSPYPYGFIGGCAGVSGDTVYFIGTLDAHPCRDKIKSAINDAGMRWVCLMPSSDFLFDLGGLIFYD